MEIEKLIYKLADQLEMKDTQELLLDIKKTNEKKYATKTQELNLRIDGELQDLQDKLDNKEYFEEFVSIFDVVSISLETVYLHTSLDLTKLMQYATGTNLEERLYKIVNKK